MLGHHHIDSWLIRLELLHGYLLLLFSWVDGPSPSRVWESVTILHTLHRYPSNAHQLCPSSRGRYRETSHNVARCYWSSWMYSPCRQEHIPSTELRRPTLGGRLFVVYFSWLNQEGLGLLGKIRFLIGLSVQILLLLGYWALSDWVWLSLLIIALE